MRSWIYTYKLLVRAKLILFAIPCLCMLFSCRNDIETIKALTSEVELPDVTGKNIEMLYTDSGMLKGKLIAPEIIQYMEKEEPYYEFPRGMKVLFYDEYGRTISYIQAKYAIYYIQKQLWEGRGQVIAESPRSGEKLETEQMFWDQQEKLIYSNKFSKMTNPDGVFIGEDGFESNEDFSKKVMKGYSGKLNVRDIPPGEQQGK